MIFQTCLLSQNKQKDDSYIIFSRVYEEPDDGPCNLFIHDETSGFGISSKKIKCTASLIDDFKKLKEKSFKWEKVGDYCKKRCIGCLRIENQLILKSNTYLDTIYFNLDEYQKLIIDYNGDSFLDNNNEIYKTLSKNNEIKAFFDAPIKQYYDDIYSEDRTLLLDSIEVEKFKINDSIVFARNVNQLDSIIKFNSLTYIQTEDRFNNKSSFEKKHEAFNYYNNSYNNYYFNEKGIIEIIEIKMIEDEYERYSNRGYIEILGLKIDDNHSKIKKLFPNSSKYIDYSRLFFKNYKDQYVVEVKFLNNNGFVNYYYKDGFLNEIKIQFYYD